MRRYTMLKHFMAALKDNDIAIFTGPTMCKEAYQYDRPTNLYIDDAHGFGLSVALGLAMGTDKRVFVFVGEGDLLRQTSVLIQMKASLCPNIFMVLVDNKAYQDGCKLPNIMEAVRSKRALMFNLGLVVFDFTIYFARKEFKIMDQFMRSIRGPMAILVDVDLGIKKNLPEIELTPADMMERLHKELSREDSGSSLHEPGPVLRVEDIKDFSELGGK